MQRRQFISLAGIAAIATQRLASAKLAGSERSTWQPDGAGSLARIGVLTPDFDPVPESEMWAMAPLGVSIHAARVTWKWNHDPREFAEAPQLDIALDQLAALKPRAIIYAFTSSSYALGAEAEGALRTRLAKRAGGISVILTCIAATEALRSIGVHRIALIHPPWFSEETNAKGKDYFRNQGLEVAFCERIAPERPFTEVPPVELYEWVNKNVSRKADAVLIGGNGLRAIGVSAGAKIPIVPVEKSSPPNVVNRDPLRIEGVPRLAKGERSARTKRVATARGEHPGDQ
jgi:maleate isomerase